MRLASACLLVMILVGCSFEPLRAPEIAAPKAYTPTPLINETASADVPGGASQRFIDGRDIPAEWWKLFKSPELDRMVREALTNSPSMSKAAARLRQAQEDLNAHTGATRFPKVDAKASAYRADVKTDSNGAQGEFVSFPLNLLFASINVSYTFDFFGAARNELDALRAEMDFERYQLEAARLALAGNVVTAAIREASLRQQIATTEQLVVLQSQQLAIIQRMEWLGGAAASDVVERRGDLARTRASLPDFQQELAQVRHRLAVFVGAPPSAPGLPEVQLSELVLPAELPLTLPSELARQRPDIRAAEALLQKAGAKVGVATANFYPQIALSAMGGSITANGVGLLSGNPWFVLLGASLAQPIFHGGELQAKRRSAVAGYEQASAAYQEVVLQAFQNVADALRALEWDAVRLKEHSEAAEQARRLHSIASDRYAAGGVSLFTLLDAERKLQSAALKQTQVTAARYADSAALLQALGGGWWGDEVQPRAGEPETVVTR